MRPDGTSYGTSGKCRAGTEQAKEAEPKKAKSAKPVNTAPDNVGKAISKLKEKVASKVASKKTEKSPDPKEAYAKLMKQQQDLIQKGDIAGAMKLNEKIKATLAKTQESPEAKAQAAKIKEEGESKAGSAKDFETAQKKRDDGQLAANLGPKDKKVIADYTKETGGQSPRSYDNMNACLRNPPTCLNTEESKKFVKEFDSALAKLPKNSEGNEFYRGVQVYSGQTEQLYKALENAQPGMRIRDPGYGSYSAERRQAEHFTNRDRKNIIFVTRSASMTPINMYSKVKEENEAILPRGAEQTIRKVTKEGNNLIVELD